MSTLDDEIAVLYGAPLSAFVAERDALAKRLQGAGRKEDAARVKALAKPSVVVWAVNQVARQAPEDVAALVDAAAALREAQLGGAPEVFREATQVQRRALKALGDRLEAVLSSGGHAATGATVERARGLLRAAAIDPAAQPLLTRGTLVSDVEASGFEALVGLGVPSEVPPARPVVDKKAEARAHEARALAAVAAREEEARSRASKAKGGKGLRLVEDHAEERASSRSPDTAQAEADAERSRAAADKAQAAAEKARAAAEAREAREAEKARAEAAEKERRAREAEQARRAAIQSRLARLEAEVAARATEAAAAQRELASARTALERAERIATHAEARVEAAREKVRELQQTLE